MNQDYIYDIEIFPNFCCITFLNANNKEDIKLFIICLDLQYDDTESLRKFVNNDINTLIGYNSLYYDDKILLYILEYSGTKINKDLFDLSKKIISSDRGENFANVKTDLFTQLDLMKLMAFDKLGVSLKQCAINLRWHKIQDLPLPYDHNVQRDEIELIIKYNINDVLISYELYQAMQPQINLRKELGKLYEVNLLSASDSKIANVLLEKFYTSETDIDISALRKLRTKRDFLWLKDCISKYIKFQTLKLRNLKFEIANTLVVGENNFAYKKTLNFGNCKYELGIGGLHSVDEPCVFKSNEKFRIVDCDVSSYYPNIIINDNIIPQHLDNNFINILSKITRERIEAKKTGNKVKADGLKITINSIFGKLGSETFWLQDAKAMLSVTVSGQLYLLMLIEALTLEGIIVVSANTDGIVCKVPINLNDKFEEVTKWWQKQTCFELEFTEYKLYIRQDVNNYITKKLDESTKEKGRFLTELDLKKGYHYPIVPRALYSYFVNNISVEDTLFGSNDILEFCLSQKTGKDFILEYRIEGNDALSLQKTNRFYVSKEGGSLVKVNKITGTEIGLCVGKLTQILNDYDSSKPITEYNIDYDYYIEEANKYINEIINGKFSEELNKEEQCTEDEDIIELELDKLDTSNTKIKPPFYRYSKSTYYYNKEKNTIYKGASSIKYITPEAADELYESGKLEFEDFVDFLVYAEENLSVNSRQMDILLKTNYFDEFGHNQKLLNIYEEFTKGKSRYKKTLSAKSKETRLQTLKNICNNLPNLRVDFYNQIANELDMLGHIQTLYPFVDKRYLYIMKLDLKWSPRIESYCLNNGKQATLKIQKKIYEFNPFGASEIIFCNEFEKKPAVKYIDGNYIEDPNTFQWWIKNYRNVSMEEFNKLLLDK
jgi:hypothetical protein